MKYTFAHSMRIEPYGWNLYLFVDRDKWARFATRQCGGQGFRKQAEGAAGIAHFNDRESEVYVGVFRGSVGTLAHEATHITNRILSAAGVSFDAGNDEPYAYLAGHLCRELWPHLKDLPQ